MAYFVQPLINGLAPISQFDTVLGKIDFDRRATSPRPVNVWYVWNQGSYDYAKMM